MENKEALLVYCQESNRICPMPQMWNELYGMLPGKKRVGGGWEPPLPLILAAWHETPGISKQLRLTEHIEWADKMGCLDEVGKYLRNLKESDWFHLGD